MKFNYSNTRRLPGWYDVIFAGVMPNTVVNSAGITNDRLLVRDIDVQGVADFEQLLKINTVILYTLACKQDEVH